MKRKRKRKDREPPALEWRGSRTVKRQEELCTPTETLATLQWAGIFSNLATGTTKVGQWTFDRPRIFCQDIEIRVVGSDVTRNGIPRHSETPYGVFYPNWKGGGRVELANGRTLDWAPTNFWATQWAFTDQLDTTLVQFENTSRLFRESVEVTYVQPRLAEADRALLLLLGYYLIALNDRDPAAVTAATTAATT